MASYGNSIIMMPNQSPFDITQNPLVNAYTSALLKKKFSNMEDADKQAQKDAQYQRYLKQAKDSGQEIQQGYSESGPTFKTKDPEELKNEDILQASLGLASDQANNTIAKRLGANPYQIAAQNPKATMSLATGGVGDVNEQPITPNSMDTRSYVSGALGKIPGLKTNYYNQKDQAETQTKEGVTSFANDYKDLVDASAGEEDLRSGLNDLTAKYADNPKVLTAINQIIAAREKYTNKKGGGRFSQIDNASTP